LHRSRLHMVRAALSCRTKGGVATRHSLTTLTHLLR
jgi:hypothetical protein